MYTKQNHIPYEHLQVFSFFIGVCFFLSMTNIGLISFVILKACSYNFYYKLTSGLSSVQLACLSIHSEGMSRSGRITCDSLQQ